MSGADHARVMDAAAFWRQFVVPFYFDSPGDRITGTLVAYRADGTGKDAVPRIRIQTGDGRLFDITAHQERLKSALVKAAPVVGARLRIVYVRDATRALPGMEPAKLFTVETVSLVGRGPGAGG